MRLTRLERWLLAAIVIQLSAALFWLTQYQWF